MPYLDFSDEMNATLEELGKIIVPEPQLDKELMKDYDKYFNRVGLYIKTTLHNFKMGSYYRGMWQYRQMHGFGEYLYKDDEQLIYYEGFFKAGLQHGFGRQIMQDGSYYIGYFINNEQEDKKGKYISKNPQNEFIIVGNFKFNKPNGLCQIVFKDGSLYNGNMKNGFRDGRGKFEWKIKSRSGKKEFYDGEWSEDQMHGLGTYKWSDSRQYTG